MSQHFVELSKQAQGIGEASLKTGGSSSVGERLARYGSSALFRRGTSEVIGRERFRSGQSPKALRFIESVAAGVVSRFAAICDQTRGRGGDSRAGDGQCGRCGRGVGRPVRPGGGGLSGESGNAEASKGTIDGFVVYPREIFRPVMVYGAVGFVVVHNHPSGGVELTHAVPVLGNRDLESMLILGRCAVRVGI